MTRLRKTILAAMAAMACATAAARDTYNFNSGWRMGDSRREVTLPRAWNEDEAFRVAVYQMSDSTVWYRKDFRLPKEAEGKRVLIEFEGARQAAEVWLNGHRVGLSENGVMAFGFDLTPYIKEGKNRIEVRTDNSWDYREQASGQALQWNAKSFYANYGGLTKNVRLHVVGDVYQTLPLYSSLGTTGTYIYGTDYDIAGREATIHAETEVRNDGDSAATVDYTVIVEEADGRTLARFSGGKARIPARSTAVLSASKRLGGLHFWSWGYGYLYRVKTIVGADTVTTTTGFRKTEFRQGMVFLNGRAMQVHGYAQRSTNEWPGVGSAVPAWLSDYSNNLLVESGGNMVRWMHVTPWRQDVESCDRVGLPQALPAGDAEKTPEGRWWEQRMELMRDAIIYNRNSPSVMFYECGNRRVTTAQMALMKSLRNEYDPHGGRAIGSREMLDCAEAEYGGEMLYVNRSDTKPMWSMEYCRDEGHRLYWNSWSYPYHKEGDGPLHRGHPAKEYNRNGDEFAAELVRRWYDYWRERPGQGTKSNAGGVKIIFSDTQTHGRSADNYRVSGVVDAMRLPKDGFYAHQVMWDGWVDDLRPRTHIVGHWNYDEGQEIPTIYVVSNAASVSLVQGGKAIASNNAPESRFLFTFRHIRHTADTITAIGYDAGGREVSRHSLVKAGAPARLKLTPIANPTGWKADGADVALVQFEVVDAEGRRCPLDNRTVEFALDGPAEWRGGVAMNKPFGTVTNQLALNTKTIDDQVGTRAWGDKSLLGLNHVLLDTLPVECGVNRVMLRSLAKSGKVVLTACAEGLPEARLTLTTEPVSVEGGLSTAFPADGLPCVLTRGETPQEPSFTPQLREVAIVSAQAGSNAADAALCFDRNENTGWSSRAKLDSAWIAFKLVEDTPVDELRMKMKGFRTTSYPIAVYAGDSLLWRGTTPKGLGYVHVPLRGCPSSRTYTVRLTGVSETKDAFAGVQELDSSNDEKAARGSRSLKIIEAEFLKKTMYAGKE